MVTIVEAKGEWSPCKLGLSVTRSVLSATSRAISAESARGDPGPGLEIQSGMCLEVIEPQKR